MGDAGTDQSGHRFIKRLAELDGLELPTPPTHSRPGNRSARVGRPRSNSQLHAVPLPPGSHGASPAGHPIFWQGDAITVPGASGRLTGSETTSGGSHAGANATVTATQRDASGHRHPTGGRGLKVIGFALLGAAVVGVLGRMLTKP